MEIKELPLADLQPNKGQIAGLPSNPRTWTKDDIERIAKSLRETPELFEARPCIVVPHAGKYVILGGNLRYEGSRKNGLTSVPCAVVPEDTPVEKMKEIVIKDNGSFGAWDYDTLANAWDDLPLLEWGVPVWDTDKEEEGTGEKEPKEEEDKAVWVRLTFDEPKDMAVFVRDDLPRIQDRLSVHLDAMNV